MQWIEQEIWATRKAWRKQRTWGRKGLETFAVSSM